MLKNGHYCVRRSQSAEGSAVSRLTDRRHSQQESLYGTIQVEIIPQLVSRGPVWKTVKEPERSKRGLDLVRRGDPGRLRCGVLVLRLCGCTGQGLWQRWLRCGQDREAKRQGQSKTGCAESRYFHVIISSGNCRENAILMGGCSVSPTPALHTRQWPPDVGEAALLQFRGLHTGSQCGGHAPFGGVAVHTLQKQFLLARHLRRQAGFAGGH